MSHWAEIKNTYVQNKDDLDTKFDKGIHKIVTIDSWKTDDINENLDIIAKVFLTEKGEIIVDYIHTLAKWDEYAQKVINETVAELEEERNANPIYRQYTEEVRHRQKMMKLLKSLQDTFNEHYKGEDLKNVQEIIKELMMLTGAISVQVTSMPHLDTNK